VLAAGLLMVLCGWSLANGGAVDAEAGWELLACVAVIAIFALLSVKAYTGKM
jgi:hypothetical protein